MTTRLLEKSLGDEIDNSKTYEMFHTFLDKKIRDFKGARGTTQILEQLKVYGDQHAERAAQLDAQIKYGVPDTTITIGKGAEALTYNVHKNVLRQLTFLKNTPDEQLGEEFRRRYTDPKVFDKMLEHVYQAADISATLSTDANRTMLRSLVQKIRAAGNNKQSKDYPKGLNPHLSAHHVFELPDFPNIVFKVPRTEQDWGAFNGRLRNVQYFTQVCAERGYDRLDIPAATIVDLGEGVKIYAEPKLNVVTDAAQQLKVFQERAGEGEMIEAVRQLTKFACEEGYADCQAGNNPPIANRNAIALLDLEPGVVRGRFECVASYASCPVTMTLTPMYFETVRTAVQQAYNDMTPQDQDRYGRIYKGIELDELFNKRRNELSPTKRSDGE